MKNEYRTFCSLKWLMEYLHKNDLMAVKRRWSTFYLTKPYDQKDIREKVVIDNFTYITF